MTNAATPGAADFWNAVDNSGRVNWWSSEKCQAYYNAAICGVPLAGSSEGCRERLRQLYPGRIFERGISVGCGLAAKETALLVDGLVKHFDLWEISEGRARTGTANLEALGLADQATYHVGNAFARVDEPQYDLVYWDHSLHHMPDVEDALAWSVKVLRPGGVVVINDYIGPNRLQWTREEVKIANGFLDRVLRARGIRTKRVPVSTPITRFRMKRRDPSEAPQSEKIEAAITRQLPGLTLAPIGGTLLNILGGFVVPAAPENDPAIDELIAEDAALRQAGSSHFAFGVWQKP